MSGGVILNWLASTPDFAVPYALAALGLIICERAGVLALGAEGLMLVGALAGIGAQIALGQPAVSLVLAMLAASAYGTAKSGVLASQLRTMPPSITRPPRCRCRCAECDDE